MFVIKVIATATEQNKNFKGTVQTTYYGKQEKILSNEELPAKWLVEGFGFKTKGAACSAMRALKEVHDRFEKYNTWTHEHSIVEIPN